MVMLLKNFRDDRRDTGPKQRYGGDYAWDEPDWDAPWRCNHITLPNTARCENCRHWCGQCLSPAAGETLIKRPEDRCEAWQVANGWEDRVAQSEGSWKPTEPWLPVFDGVNR